MRAGAGTRCAALLGAIAVAGGLVTLEPVTAAERRTGTLKDLEDREIEVQPDPPSGVLPQHAIEQYRRFLELEAAQPSLRAEAMRRLGDLQVEADESARIEGESVAPGLDLREAIELYQGLLDGFPRYERRDNVMYQLARAYEAAGEPQSALAVLDRLVEQHPDSPWYTEAQFRRGEILFSTERYRDAEHAYAAVIAAGVDGGFYEQGLYKHGWSLFKQSRGEESVASFMTLLDRVLVADGRLREQQSLTRPERELTEDTLRVMSIAFSDLDGPQTLDAMLLERGADSVYAHVLYEALGNLYLEKERYQDAALAYEAFAKRRPDDRFAPLLQMRTIDAYQKGGFASLVLAGKQAFVERYAFDSAFWAARTPAEAPEVAEQLKANQRDLAVYYHAQAQKTRAADDYRAAARWYGALLDSFPQDPQAPQTRYALGDVLFESGRFAEAAHEYERTAYDYPLHQQSAAAGYAALIAYEKHRPALDGEAAALWHRQSIESSLMFATSFPRHPEASRVLTRAAEALFALDEFDRTIEVARQILELDPPAEPAHQRTAATLLAHSLFDRGRYAEAEQAYVRVQSYLPSGDPDRAGIEERLAAAIYRQAEARQQAGDAQGAVEDFLRVAVLAPNAEVRATAEFDAASILVREAQWERAARVLEGLRRNFPDHELAPEVTRSLAVAYLESGRAGESAAEFERIAARVEEPSDVRRAALWQAAELYAGAGLDADASRAYQRYVEQFPRPLDAAMDARLRLADMARARDDVAERTRWIEAIIRADRDAGAERTDRSRYLAARAMLETAEPHVAMFNSIRLVAPLDRSLAAKRSAMEKALGIYGDALDYGVAEVTTAATYGMAEMYRRLGSDLMESERPTDLDEEELEQYEVLLEEQAFPFEEQAIELHEANARRAAEGIYDEWVQRSFAELARLMPVRWGKAEVGDEYVSSMH